MGGNISPRCTSNSTSVSTYEHRDQGKTIETWNISLEITNSYSYDDAALVNCYEKILKTVSKKCQEFPAYKYVNSMHEKFEDYNHIFNYRLHLNQHEGPRETKCNPAMYSLTSLKSKSKRSEFKFDVGFGKLRFDVDYITLKSLVQINEYLVQNFSSDKPLEEDAHMQEGNVMHEYFSEQAESIHSSHNSQSDKDYDDSDEFVLITTSENFGEPHKNKDEEHFQVLKIASKEESKKQGMDAIHEVVLEKRESDSDDYQFDTEALFRNKVNPSNKKFKISFDEEQQRLRCNSDNTACSRFKNILNSLKPSDSNSNGQKVFQKQQFEYKNCLSPSVMNNFVIDEGYFGEENTKGNSSQVRSRNQSGFEDDDFNPFVFQKSDNSEASGSQMGEAAPNRGPAFRALREFRTSIDGTNDPSAQEGRPNSSLFGKTHKQRKFTLSFDGSIKPTSEADDFLNKFNEDTTLKYKVSSFKRDDKEIREEDASFELNIEDDYFTDDLSDFNQKESQDFGKDANQSPHNIDPLNTDRNTRESTQGSQSKVAKSNERSNCLDSSQFESLLFTIQQACTDSCLNNLNTSDDFSLFLNYMENIRKKLGSSTESNSEASVHKASKKDDKFQLKETMISNYVEIIELREKLNESTFDSILN